jgi:hypothetical protein
MGCREIVHLVRWGLTLGWATDPVADWPHAGICFLVKVPGDIIMICGGSVLNSSVFAI